MKENHTNIQTSNRKSKTLRSMIWSFFSSVVVVLLLMVGLTLMFHDKITYHLIDSRKNEYISSPKNSPEKLKLNEERQVTYDASNVRAINSAELLEEFVNESIKSNNHFSDLPVIGGIAIPDVGMNLPIFKGLDNAGLAVGAGTAKEHQILGRGNYTLASHSLFYGPEYDNVLFKPLHKMKSGMKIYVRDASKIYEYTTSKVYVVNPDEGYVMSDSEGDGVITLITCTDDAATKRLIVRGVLSDVHDIKDSPKEITEFFGSDWTRFY